MNARTWGLYGVLVALAIAFALLTRTTSDEGGELPSIANPRGGGLKALKRYLEATGVEVRTVDDDLAKAEWSALVIPAPTARQLTEAEVRTIDDRVRAGATLVYLSAAGSEQPVLDGWLLLQRGPRLQPEPIAGDTFGATAKVGLQKGVFAGLDALRVSSGRGIVSTDPSLLTIATSNGTPVLLWKKHGDGQILVGAGADLAENRRLELLDNRKLWDNLGALGPVTFDELHHQKPPSPPMSLGILAFGAQALFAVLFLTFARGTRLGPPRPLSPQRHRAGVEYARSFAWLLRGARAEAELSHDVLARLRRLIHDRLGLPLSLSASEFGRELERRLTLPAGTWEELERQAKRPSPTPKDFAALTRKAAEVEQAVLGTRY